MEDSLVAKKSKVQVDGKDIKEVEFSEMVIESFVQYRQLAEQMSKMDLESPDSILKHFDTLAEMVALSCSLTADQIKKNFTLSQVVGLNSKIQELNSMVSQKKAEIPKQPTP